MVTTRDISRQGALLDGIQGTFKPGEIISSELQEHAKTWLVGTWSIKLDENAGFWRYQTRGANTKLGGSDDPMGCQKNRESRSPSGSADLGYGTHIRNACLYDCLVKFLIGRRVYLEVIIGVSIALGLVALLLASAQTPAVPAAQTPARLPAWALGPFKRFADINPIITPRPASVFSCPMRRRDIHWEMLHTFNPAAITVNDRIAVLYRAEDDTGQGIGGHTSRIGLWTSIDGSHPTERFSLPVLYPDKDISKPFEWDGGCEDPRIVQAPDGIYVLTYVAWNRSKANICIATSRDLHIWKKHGPAFKSASPTDGEWTKSGSIVTTVVGRKIVAARIKGKYWMYWEHDSEADPSIFLAVSQDLVHWTPVVGADGDPVPVLKTRKGSFDARLMDPGPPPLLTSAGIIFIYNGKNGDAHDGDQAYPLLSYSMGQALFSADDPAHVIDRLQKPFLVPELPFERSGQYTNGTAFAEGLALKNGTWYLYYGSADSVIAVATWTPSRDDLGTQNFPRSKAIAK